MDRPLAAAWTPHGLPPIPTLVDRTRWNHVRRWWKELLLGRPEDRLGGSAREERIGQALLFTGIGTGLLVAPLAGAWAEASITRIGLLGLTGLAIVAALQLEALQRAGSDGAAAGMRGLLAGAVAAATLGIALGNHPELSWVPIWLAASLLALMALAFGAEPRMCLSAGSALGLGGLAFALWRPGGSPAHGLVGGAMLFVGTVLAAALAKRGRDLRRTRHRDGLTRLLARHAMLACLAREAERAARAKLPITLAVIEATRLDGIRAQHGSALADAILCWLANLVHESVRSSDLVARFADDQIVVAFLDSDDAVLFARLEQLGERADAIAPIDAESGLPASLGVRIGTASFPHDDVDVAGALAQALGRAGFGLATDPRR